MLSNKICMTNMEEQDSEISRVIACVASVPVRIRVFRILTACELRWLYRVECVWGSVLCLLSTRNRCKRSLSTFIFVHALLYVLDWQMLTYTYEHSLIGFSLNFRAHFITNQRQLRCEHGTLWSSVFIRMEFSDVLLEGDNTLVFFNLEVCIDSFK